MVRLHKFIGSVDHMLITIGLEHQFKIHNSQISLLEDLNLLGCDAALLGEKYTATVSCLITI